MKVNKVRFWMMYHMNMNVIVKRVNIDDKTTKTETMDATFKGDVHSILSHGKTEVLNNMNKHGQIYFFIKCYFQQK